MLRIVLVANRHVVWAGTKTHARLPRKYNIMSNVDGDSIRAIQMYVEYPHIQSMETLSVASQHKQYTAKSASY